MRYRILDVDNDYSFGRGNQNITYGIYAVAQAIQTRLLLLKGEWWENLDNGLPLFQDILGHRGTGDRIMLVDSIIKERIANTKNVIGVREFSSTYENRSYAYSCKVDTRFGELNLQNEKVS